MKNVSDESLLVSNQLKCAVSACIIAQSCQAKPGIPASMVAQINTKAKFHVDFLPIFALLVG